MYNWLISVSLHALRKLLYNLYTCCSIVESSNALHNNFYLGYFKNWKGGTPSILLSTVESLPVSYSIEAPGIGFYRSGVVTSYHEVIINFPKSIVVSSPNHQDKGIHLNVSNDKVTVIGQNVRVDSSDTFLALPIINMSVSEYVYYGISVDEGTATTQHGGEASSILIVGTENNTSMSITARWPVIVGYGNFKKTTSSHLVINRLQTVFIKSHRDLSGTRIVTDKPVSVFSGHGCGNVPKHVSFCDHLIEQIPPTALWGKVFYVAPLASRRSYTIKVLAAHNSTDVETCCNATKSSYTIDSGDFINKTLTSQEYCTIHSSKVVMVVQFSHGYRDDGKFRYGDPLMTLVPSTTNYGNNFLFSTIRNAQVLPFYNHYINIIVLAKYFQPEMIHLINGNTNRSLVTAWVPFEVNNITEAYGMQVAISKGVNKVIHRNLAALMTTIVYGFTRRYLEGYGHPGGFYIAKHLSGKLLHNSSRV